MNKRQLIATGFFVALGAGYGLLVVAFSFFVVVGKFLDMVGATWY